MGLATGLSVPAHEPGGSSRIKQQPAPPAIGPAVARAAKATTPNDADSLRSLIQYSPVQSLRPGFSRTTQLLATEIYDVLARGKDHNPKLVSFADSRQTAARTALDVEHLHHRDLLREVLMVTLMEVDAERRRPPADGDHPGQQGAPMSWMKISQALLELRAVPTTRQPWRALLERRKQLAVPLQQQAPWA